MKCDFIANSLSGDLEKQLESLYSLYEGISEQASAGRLFLICRQAPDSLASFSDELICLRSERPTAAEIIPALLKKGAGTGGLCLTSDNSLCRELASRLASRLKGQSLLGVNAIFPYADGLTAFKMIYAGRLEGRLLMTREPFFVSAGTAGTVAAKCKMPGFRSLTPEVLDILPSSQILASSCVACGEETSFKDSKCIVAIGRGMANQRGMIAAKKLAAALCGELGATRSAVMSGVVPMQKMLGVSGAAAAPELCIIGGASGSAAFLAGIEKSGLIIAVNTDSDAPIRHCADVFINGDGTAVFEALADVIQRSADL